MTTPAGPNARRLFAMFVTHEVIPPDSKNGLADGRDFIVGCIKNAPEAKEKMRKAFENYRAAIAYVRAAPDNPYRNEEEIAGAILAAIEKKKKTEKTVFDVEES